ncbi:hypothetical protein BGX31_000778 [Mortierella sp. GBA43]|nr:hypothetical protein BGX31_000778 [Mortierella sp. GBA43]
MPAYKKLSDGPQAGSVPCGLSPDGKTWVAIVNDNVHTYDIASDQWHFNVTQIKSFTLREVTGAVDPDSGKLYIPFGITTSSTVLMFVLETKTPYVYYYSDLGGAPIERYGYTVAWSRAMKSMIYVGGTAIYSYSPSTGWSDLRLSTDGQSPPGSRYFPCVVAAGDSKIIVFGGQNRINNQTTLGDIYILDVLTKKWKQGMSVNAPQGRSAGPCAYSNNQFIIWGGVRTTNGTSTNEDPNPTLMVYNLETNTWTTNYTAPLQPAIGATVGNVVGSVAGGLVVIALVGFGVSRYRKRTHGNKFSEKRPGRPADPHTDPHHSTGRNPTYIPPAPGGLPVKDYVAALGLDQEPGHPHTTPLDIGFKLPGTTSDSPSYYPPPPATGTSLESGSSPNTYGVNHDAKQHVDMSTPRYIHSLSMG